MVRVLRIALSLLSADVASSVVVLSADVASSVVVPPSSSARLVALLIDKLPPLRKLYEGLLHFGIKGLFSRKSQLPPNHPCPYVLSMLELI